MKNVKSNLKVGDTHPDFIKSKKPKVTEFQAVADTIIKMVDDNYIVTNSFDPAKILVGGICNSLHDFFIPNAESWHERCVTKAQELNELKDTKREQDQEIAGDTQTRQDKINLQDAIDNTRENFATAQEDVAVAKKKIEQLETMLEEMSAVYQTSFQETWVPSKDKKKNVQLPKRLQK